MYKVQQIAYMQVAAMIHCHAANPSFHI